MPTMAFAALALLLQASIPKEPAKDLTLHSKQVPGVEMRFIDYHFRSALFEAMASGKGDIPEAKRNWVLVRLVLDSRPLTLEGTRVPVGNYLLALWPNLDGKGMQVEIRRVDMRDLYLNPNAIAPLPPGETVYKGPARFETVGAVQERLDVELAEANGVVELVLRYGDRRLALKLTR